ncbi:hypothetical protein M9Y10_000846 [Tritrichomonas musculus]|uniref:E3 ubiquitin-protein ligase n=1 Tax=Tritrichomonas musculus TaxID=1915356 RepID=A0ABR2L5B9_9EUKA
MKSFTIDSKKKSKTIKKWEKELTPSSYSSFSKFDQYQKEHATFNRCYASQQDSTIFFHCRECCKTINGLYCVNCFNQSQHTDHHVSVMLLNDAFCDCGHSKYIKKELWCTLHREYQETKIPDDYLTLLKNKIYEIFDYAVKNPDKKSFSEALQFLLSLTEWGSNYIDLISQILYDGHWENSFYGKIFKNYKSLASQNIEKFRRLLLKMVSSSVFKKGFISCVTQTLEILSLVYSDPGFPKTFLDIADFSYQCLTDGKIDVELQETDSFFTNMLNFLGDIYSSQLFLIDGKYQIPLTFNYDFHFLISSILYSIISNPLMCKFIIDQPDCLKSLVRVLSINSKNAIIQRVTTEKVITTGIHIAQSKNIATLHSTYEYFSRIFPFLTVKIEDDVNYDEVLEYPIENLNDSHILTLNFALSTFTEELNKFLDFEPRNNSFNSTSYFIQPYTDEFVIDHPLAKAVISCATNFAIFNAVDLFTIFDRIDFDKFDQLAAVFASCEAGKCQIIHGLFPMNDDSILLLADHSDQYGFFILPALQSLISIKSRIKGSNLSGDIVMIIAESFGLPIWEKEKDLVDCQRWTNVMTSMLRLFINLSCNDNFFNFLIDHEKIRRMIIDYIYCGLNNRMKIIERINEFTYDINFIDEEFEKVVNIRVDNQGSHFNLKPEYDDTSSVFSPYLFVHEFNNKLAYEITHHKDRLLRLSRFDPPEALSGLKLYLQTEEMKSIIHRILTTTLNDTEKFSISCSHTLFSLIRLVLLESEDPEETEKNYIESDIINLLIKLVKKLDNGVLILQSFINECKPRYMKIAEIVEKEIQEDLHKRKKNKPKIDKSKILAQFSNAQNKFATKNEEELKTVENISSSSFTCACCEDQFNLDKPYGIFADIYKSSILNKIEATIANDKIDRYPTLCQIRTCGHWSHLSCFEQENNLEIEYIINDMGKRCPLDRSCANAIIPVFNGDAPPDDKWKEAFQKLSDRILNICGSSVQQCLAYNIALIEILTRHNPKFIDDKRSVLGLIHLSRSCFFIDPSSPILKPADPFVEFTYNFCSGGNLKESRQKFDKMLPDFWRNLMESVSINEKDQQLSMIETYIRRISLLEQFVFSKDSDSFDLPSVSEFIESHHLKKIDDEIKDVKVDLEKVSFLSSCHLYSFPNLKDKFIDYILNSKIIQENQHSSYNFCLCLLCGKMCCIRTSIEYDPNAEPKVSYLYNHCMKCNENLCTPILFLTGLYASSICIWDGDFENKKFVNSIYTDKYGDENIGLKNGNMLFLNKYKVASLFEDLITGEIRRKLEDFNSQV